MPHAGGTLSAVRRQLDIFPTSGYIEVSGAQSCFNSAVMPQVEAQKS